MAEGITSENRAEIARLRSFVHNRERVDLLHSAGGSEAWLCDGVVMIRVTGSPAITGLDDGEYRIVAGKGLIRNQDKARDERDKPIMVDGKPAMTDRGPRFNLPIYFGIARGYKYHRAYATRFSLTDNEAKAMIMFVDVDMATAVKARMVDGDIPAAVVKPDNAVLVRYPLAMNEDVWKAIRRAYPLATLSHPGHGGPFLIGSPGIPVLAYVEPIQIPESEQGPAVALVEACEYPEENTEDG
jgi:hypothetical protein